MQNKAVMYFWVKKTGNENMKKAFKYTVLLLVLMQATALAETANSYDYYVNNYQVPAGMTIVGHKAAAGGGFIVDTTASRVEYLGGRLAIQQKMADGKILKRLEITLSDSPAFTMSAADNSHIFYQSTNGNIMIYGDGTLVMFPQVNGKLSYQITPLPHGLAAYDDNGGYEIHALTSNGTVKDSDDSQSDLQNGTGFVVNIIQKTTLTTGSYTVFTYPSLKRLLQGDTLTTGETIANVYCAKNEYESFQIIVSNLANNTLNKITLKTGSWYYNNTVSASHPDMILYREHYVHVTQSSHKLSSRLGWYPDALVPFINPYTHQAITQAKYLADNQNIAAHKSQAYWIDIHVPANMPAGTYTNQLAVLSQGKLLGTIPVNITVWDFTLPAQHKLKTYFGSIRPNLYTYLHLPYDSQRYKDIWKRYKLALCNNGITPVMRINPKRDSQTGEAIFSQKYIAELRDFVNEYHSQLYKIVAFYADDPVKQKNYLISYHNFLRDNPWVGVPCMYFVDEPKTLEAYQKIISYGKALNKYAPEIKMLVTKHIQPAQPGFPSLEGYVDIWVPTWGAANPNDIKRRQQAGDEVWSYITMTQRNVPSWLIDSPLMDYRIPAWFSWNLDLKGILYWQTTYWLDKYQTLDVWNTALTYTSKDGKYSYNGEGVLLYPGEFAGIDGPVVSMRLKVFRDSVEDYDYFSILESLSNSTTAKSLVAPVASSFKVYSKDYNAYLNARKKVAQKILELKSK